MQQHSFAPPPLVYHQGPPRQVPPPQGLPSNNQHNLNNGWGGPPSPHGIPNNNPYGPNNGWVNQLGAHGPESYGPAVRAQTQPQMISYEGSYLAAAQPYQAQQPLVIQQQGQNHDGWSQQDTKVAGAGKQTVVAKQPTPDKAMKYAVMTEEERTEHERRGQQVAATKQFVGKTCVACGKVCKAAAVMCSAMVCVLGCLMSCIPE